MGRVRAEQGCYWRGLVLWCVFLHDLRDRQVQDGRCRQSINFCQPCSTHVPFDSVLMLCFWYKIDVAMEVRVHQCSYDIGSGQNDTADDVLAETARC